MHIEVMRTLCIQFGAQVFVALIGGAERNSVGTCQCTIATIAGARACVHTNLVGFALGVERETVIADFEESNKAYRPIVERLNKDVIERGGGEDEMAVIQAFMGVSTANFISTLDLIDREFGGMTNYLHEILCLSREDMQILRKRYLE